ncbi:MAG TPA: transposase [Cytophagales bacterium]|nr:transposase [Cytophagales bacterium]
MSEKYKFNDKQGMYFVTMATVGWVDLFTRWELKHVIIDSLRYCQKEKGLIIHAWCLMPSHLHLIISIRQESLSDIMRDFKKFTSKELIKTMERINESRKDWILELFGEVADGLKRVSGNKVWQDGNHPEQLISAKFTKQKLNYLHENPVADEIVDEPEEYRYSSARDYYSNKKGYLEVDVIE